MNQVQKPNTQEVTESGKYLALKMTSASNSSELPCPPCRLEKLRLEKLRKKMKPS